MGLSRRRMKVGLSKLQSFPGYPAWPFFPAAGWFEPSVVKKWC